MDNKYHSNMYVGLLIRRVFRAKMIFKMRWRPGPAGELTALPDPITGHMGKRWEGERGIKKTKERGKKEDEE